MLVNLQRDVQLPGGTTNERGEATDPMLLYSANLAEKVPQLHVPDPIIRASCWRRKLGWSVVEREDQRADSPVVARRPPRTLTFAFTFTFMAATRGASFALSQDFRWEAQQEKSREFAALRRRKSVILVEWCDFW